MLENQSHMKPGPQFCSWILLHLSGTQGSVLSCKKSYKKGSICARVFQASMMINKRPVFEAN